MIGKIGMLLGGALVLYAVFADLIGIAILVLKALAGEP